MLLLDLFCGAGGCTKGYQQAGFWVRGVDLNPQPRYVGEEFVQADALGYLAGLIESGEIEEFDAIHASPPCQAHTAMRTMWNANDHPDLIEPTRKLLKATGLPYAIENVEGAPLNYPLRLCGTMFGLGVGDAELRRHRVFECSFYAITSPCQHGKSATIGVYGGHARNRTRTIGIYGEGARDSRRKADKGIPDFSVEDARIAMGIGWMTLAEMCQAIPPAYTEFIGRQLISQLEQIKKAA